MLKQVILVAGLISLAGCQSLPTQHTSPTPSPAQPGKKPGVETPDGVKITPYDRPEIQRKQLQVIVPQQKTQLQKFDDGRQLPVFKQLMQETQTAFKQGKWDEAEKSAMHAQRLAPQSAETFLYLALIAGHKNQPANAESLARRGLSYAQSNAMKKQLWQIILKAGQSQNKAGTVQEAQARLKSL
ncbi:tetratricopeptide repeat protein [Acinetobacter sp. WZC-1]|uniref:tetratricopeptide repeat protein n=1 Tax=Acinetobacter sp. WZC-1 TaxID=3459034 RepID=UPI00403D5662